MKVYYLLDESEIGGHISHYDALEFLKLNNEIADYKICSFIFEERSNGWSQTLEKAKKEIREFKPNIIVLSHTGKRHIPKSFFYEIRTILKKVVFVYDERDVHGFITKRFPLATLSAAKNCDLVFLVAKGLYAKVYKTWGCEDIRYLASVADDVRFGKDYAGKVEKDKSIILIGNFLKGRGFSMPGVKQRYELVKALSKYYGKHFRVYGHGWKEFDSWDGPIKFEQQEELIASSRLSIGLNHFYYYHSYFSDRTPIALISGVPHLTINTPGVSEIFKPEQYCFYYNSVHDAIIQSKKILDKDLSENQEFSESVRSFIKINYTEKVRMKALVTQAIEKLHLL